MLSSSQFLALLVPQPIERSVCLLPEAQVGQTVPERRGILHCVPQLLFGLQVDVSLVVKERGREGGTSYVAMMLKLPPIFIFIAE